MSGSLVLQRSMDNPLVRIKAKLGRRHEIVPTDVTVYYVESFILNGIWQILCRSFANLY